MDLTILTDSELDAHRREVQTEQERRQRLASAPLQVADTARRYVEDGGDPADLQAAIAAVETPPAP